MSAAKFTPEQRKTYASGYLVPHTGIVTEYWRKPVPTDAYDWIAYREEDAGEDGKPWGHGRTEYEAITNLREQLEDE